MSKTTDIKIRKDIDKKFLTSDNMDLNEKLEDIMTDNEEFEVEEENIQDSLVKPIFADMPQMKGRKAYNMAKLSNGLTPYEMMYGKIDDEDILQTYIDNS